MYLFYLTILTFLINLISLFCFVPLGIETVYAAKGSFLVLTCSGIIKADNAKWEKKGCQDVLAYKDDVNPKRQNDIDVSHNDTIGVYVMTIRSFNVSHEGGYTCTLTKKNETQTTKYYAKLAGTVNKTIII